MPPAKTLSVKRATSQVSCDGRRKNFKPYKENTSNETDIKKNIFSGSYMDLDEFFQKMSNKSEPENTTSHKEDKDYPRPSGDLLASLYTLGKMIQQQKQLIQHQTKNQNIFLGIAKTKTTTSLPGVPMVVSSDTASGAIVGRENKHIVCDTSNHFSGEKALQSCMSTSSVIDEVSSSGVSSVTSVNLHSCIASSNHVIPESCKDMDYYAKRKKNNLAAKKSREERRNGELEVLSTAKELENENAQLTVTLKRLTARNELLESRLREIRKRQAHPDSSEFSTVSE